MIGKLKCTLLLAAAGLALTGRPAVSIADELEDALRQVDKLRAGFDTPFDEVEKRCDALLQTYTAPEDQARIYYELANVEAQSGHQRPAKSLRYTLKALGLPLEREKRLQLYMYWGSAIGALHRGARGDALKAARKQAAMAYLQGLKEALQYAEEVQKTPLPPPWEPKLSDQRRPLNKRAMTARASAAGKREDLLRDLTIREMAFQRSLAFLYSRAPFATDELEKLAREVLKDTPAVVRLKVRVMERVIHEEARAMSSESGSKD